MRSFLQCCTRLALLALVAAMLAACGGLNRIDRRIDRLVERQSAAISAPEGSAPTGDWPTEQEAYEEPGQARINPPTLNPDTEELTFIPAPPDRDVAAALESYAEPPKNALAIDIQEAIRIAQENSREYRTAEEDYLLAAIRLLIERHRFSPRFFDELSASLDGSIADGADAALTVMNELRVTRQLPYGGNVEAALITQATEQLRASATEDYVASSQLVLSADIPLLRNAGLIAREDLIQAERELVYGARDFERFRREFFVDIATDYFNLAAQVATIINQERSLESRLASADRARARVEAGKDPASDFRELQADVLFAQSSLSNLREAYILALDRFKIRLGISVETPVVIEPSIIELPEPARTPGEAARRALLYRLDLQNDYDRIADSRRDVSNSYNQLLPDLDVNASIASGGGPFADDNDLVDFDFDDSSYNLGVTFGLPLDRRIERLNLRSSIINLQRSIRGFETFRDTVILNARAARRAIDQQRLNLLLAEEEVESNRLRLEEQIIKEEEANRISEAQDDLLRAQNDRDEAIRDLRIAVLEYLLATGALRIGPDGRFQPLPGMELALEDPADIPRSDPARAALAAAMDHRQTPRRTPRTGSENQENTSSETR